MRPLRPLFAPRAALVALCLGLSAFAALAEEHELSPPRFLLEAIEVEGLRRASEEIVVSESLLVPGQTYTDAEILSGVRRV